MTTLSTITSQMEAYFTGLHQADSDILRTVFHPDAVYVNATAGDYLHHTMPDYMAIIDKRTSPETLGEPKSGEILSIELDGEQMAFVKARMSMLGRNYLDFLTFVKTDGRWQIMSKVFSYQATAKEA